MLGKQKVPLHPLKPAVATAGVEFVFGGESVFTLTPSPLWSLPPKSQAQEVCIWASPDGPEVKNQSCEVKEVA